MSTVHVTVCEINGCTLIPCFGETICGECWDRHYDADIPGFRERDDFWDNNSQVDVCEILECELIPQAGETICDACWDKFHNEEADRAAGEKKETFEEYLRSHKFTN